MSETPEPLRALAVFRADDPRDLVVRFNAPPNDEAMQRVLELLRDQLLKMKR